MPCHAVMSTSRLYCSMPSRGQSSSCSRISSVSQRPHRRSCPSERRSRQVLLGQAGQRWMASSFIRARSSSLTLQRSGLSCSIMLMVRVMKLCKRPWFGCVLLSTVPEQLVCVSTFVAVWCVNGTRPNISIPPVCCSRWTFPLWCGLTSPWISWRVFHEWAANLWC